MLHEKPLFVGVLLGAALLGGILHILYKSEPLPSEATTEIVMREVGHRVLLAVGDDSTRVLPIGKSGDGAYLIRFEAPLTFTSDTLVNVIHSSLAKGLGEERTSYIVNVISCAGEEIVYGYQISWGLSGQQTIVPCSGREQPSECYTIAIRLGNRPRWASAAWIGGASLLSVVLLVGFGLLYKQKHTGKTVVETEDEGKARLAVGSYVFYPDKHLLQHQNSLVTLTSKETRLLFLFASQPNEVLLRDRLMKEVWEDEGVFVGRSLDMFISRLRKRLQLDSAIRLVNIHGRGYKLEID